MCTYMMGRRAGEVLDRALGYIRKHRDAWLHRREVLDWYVANG